MRKFIILAALALMPLAANAQCRTVQRYAPSYANTYVAPTYDYQIVQPVAVATFLVPNEFYSIQPDIAAAKIQQQIADDAADRAIAKMLQLLRQQQQQMAAPNQPAPAPPPIDPGVGLANPHEHTSSLTTKVQAMANAKCVACHHDLTNRIDLRDVSKLDDIRANKMVVRTTLLPGEEGFMPKPKGGGKGESITPQEYNDLAHWAIQVAKHGSGAIIGPSAAPKVIPPAADVPGPVEQPKPPSAPGGAKDKDKGGEDGSVSLLPRRVQALGN